jgi:hypothetical protein
MRNRDWVQMGIAFKQILCSIHPKNSTNLSTRIKNGINVNNINTLYNIEGGRGGFCILYSPSLIGVFYNLLK